MNTCAVRPLGSLKAADAFYSEYGEKAGGGIRGDDRPLAAALGYLSELDYCDDVDVRRPAFCLSTIAPTSASNFLAS